MKEMDDEEAESFNGVLIIWGIEASAVIEDVDDISDDTSDIQFFRSFLSLAFFILLPSQFQPFLLRSSP
jgi:hypothetical protein